MTHSCACSMPLPGSDGGWATTCSFSNACDAGLFCADAATLPGCTRASCCSEFCDVTQPDPDAQCTGAADGAECLSWWNGDPSPPGYDHVGFCGPP
ncbi:MAG: hypothetical protein IAG13_22500 [Deltaproteobacteria bacterium]|nr:hypothetical protein [Nannocystaceae bacterium]